MDAPPKGTRIEIAKERGWSESWDAYANEHTWGIVDALQEIADQVGKSVAQVAINWLLRQPGVTAPILGARNLRQLEDNLGAVGWELDEEQVRRLNEASARPLPYPYDFVTGAQEGRVHR